MRSKRELIEAQERGERLKLVCFWSHEGVRDKVGAWVLSQWFPATFTVDGVDYPTAEHWMMASKARLFGDEAAEQRVLETAHPGAAKAIGREVRSFDHETWEAARVDVVIAGNLAKFTQHDALGSYLTGTGERVLVEASPTDRIWGAGLSADHPDIERAAAWPGENLLGFALMQVRRTLRGE